MKVTTFMAFLLLASGYISVAAAADTCAPQFHYCEGKLPPAGQFADCTRAKCEWDNVSSKMKCTCDVVSNVPSTTSGECKEPTEPLQRLQSRYSLVDTMGVCTGATHRWGWCLDIMCDNNFNTATCWCDTAKSETYDSKQYVIVGGTPGDCQAHYSSATVSQVLDATAFLRCKQPHRKIMDPQILWVTPSP
jgi:hypothetical protein